jgi:hypothetical protein
MAPPFGFEQTDWIALRDARSTVRLVHFHGIVWAHSNCSRKYHSRGTSFPDNWLFEQPGVLTLRHTPKNTSVGLAVQKASHIRIGEAVPRISGKYLPSQLRTQKLGPELATTGRSGGCGGGGWYTAHATALRRLLSRIRST